VGNNCRFLTVLATGCVFLVQMGCEQRAGRAPEPNVVVSEPKPSIGPADVNALPDIKEKEPRIKFENVVHDFGEVGPGSTHHCEFKFINAGDGVLRLKKPRSACACAVARLSKEEYAPGEPGSVRIIRFSVPTHQGRVSEDVFVSSNDRIEPKVRLIVQAEVVQKVAPEPNKLKLLLNDENAGCPEIILTSVDGQAFAIKGFKATTDVITADYDSSVEAKRHVIQPKIDTEKLPQRARGRISIELTHPECEAVVIPFEVLPKFKIDPPWIVFFDAVPGEPTIKSVKLLSNYGEDFEVESVSSEKDLIKVVSRNKIGSSCKLEIEITPPPDASKNRFTDVFHIQIKGGQRLPVICTGFYSKK